MTTKTSNATKRPKAAARQLETYKGIEPHPSRVAAFAKTTAADRRFWDEPGYLSPAHALTPERFVQGFSQWALSYWDETVNEFALVNLKLKKLRPQVLGAEVRNMDGTGNDSGAFISERFYELCLERVTLEVMRDALEALPLENERAFNFSDLNWNHASVRA